MTATMQSLRWSRQKKPKFPLDITSLPGEKFLFQLAWGPDVIETGSAHNFCHEHAGPKDG